MPEPRNLTPEEEEAPRLPSPPVPEVEADPLRFLKADRSVQRASLYFFIFVVLLVGAVGPVQPPAVPNPEVHDILEALATLLAFVVGSLALVRFYAKKRGTFLFLGTGFLGSGVLDLFHILVSVGAGPWGSPARVRDLSAWTFTASGSYLATFLLASWISWRRETRDDGRAKATEVPVYLGAALLAAVLLVALFFLPLTVAFYPDATLRQPAELFPAFLLLLALAGYLQKGHWRQDTFEHWMVLALVVACMAHGAYMPFAARFHDADFLVAHVLKLLSYGCVLVGLMASVHVTFRREEAAAEAAQTANAALAREIDYRRKAERVLQESEERLQDFLDNAHDLIQSVAPDGRFLYVNRAWAEALGYAAEDLRDLRFLDVVHPSCRTRCAAEFEAVLRGQALPSVEVDFLTADGRVVRCSGSANARFKDGKAVATRSILRDITSQVETRRELEAFQANLQALVENTGDAIWSVDRSLRLITFNTAFSMILEARTGREPMVEDLPEDAFPPEDAAWYREMYQRCLKGASFSEMRDEEFGGQVRSSELFFNPIREAMGITGVAVFGKDVTARRRTQVALRMAKEEAERANRAKSQFLANMSHELRTPLNSVIGFTNILLKNKSGRFKDQELNFLERISANGKHLLHLINQVLDLAKIEAGRMELEREAVDLAGLLREIVAQMEGQVKEKPVSLRAEVPEDLPPLETDSGKLKQIIINLVGNAIKFTNSGEVAVEVIPEEAGGGVSAIRVRDTGIGIPSERLHAIFEAFQQADGTTSRRFGGTGLGLTISRSLCQLLGYDLQVDSEVGRGSSFSILVAGGEEPAQRPEDELIAEALQPIRSSRPRRGTDPSPDTPLGSRTVLVVDDDHDSRILVTHHLEDLGWDVVTADSAGDGFEQARRERPDLIILDLTMPGVPGWEAFRELKEDPELRNVPVIMVSGLAGEGEDSALLGPVDLMTKPIEKERLLETIERNLKETRDRKILIVEDDPDARNVMREYTEAAGMTVALAGDGREGLERLLEGIPDAILLDLVMPVMDGPTFLKRLHREKRYRGIPVILCTGKDLTRNDLERLQAQAAGVVVKGERMEEELRTILSRLFSPAGAPSPEP
ncbi:MAG: response regulator [Longimicrobiales bacterium]